MPENKRFMEAVAAKVGAKRKPMMKRKGGPSVIIAIGAPKPGPMGEKPETDDSEEKVDHSKMSKAEHIAYLQEKIASLKAELALLEDEDEMDSEDKASEDEQDYEDEDEED